ncbi:MAG: 23S rRNA (pseudouridine(1915)-N(3))-methyltransferase RlmH [Cetobacterium somerae]|jgi:23S rRNA (pseudouridine1915-N3)-methyltransferase|uniref:Ribosomal RNA large subunit methyltransferase H n=1 Tax=Cetobacterium somerae ATCC BAA-474 TaxID=1319815 RepID=U7V867_9FUSO|nr:MULTISPECIES: 23S rRNA (pseudouridine(1915)-N(3))-methyltransferase RlmH [Cetobacterium]ERT67676.1 putative rRNA large subunit m3Psi methyltransferase RlmH [Cetobacterium somerae ATCC BAA-474]MBC2853796.1 23S rRNA (pseudouridine(1915)-N(3))-methyltransferase RlmH [Cetobacterium sp. 2G large]MCQ9625641.1 23S rRNA (pseudouridine(1915)-N(3))-methyltransferase RlmH [Cetobacterium somerae]WVJ00257.1 23S rRNA (pseudouridine(1915)-N(3))-methyltransferase RlmH [Cetobacterium somerae]
MNINIICVGKIKEKYILDGIQEFAKRMQAFGKLKIFELKEDGNDSNRNMSIEKESKSILETLEKNKGFKILLDIQGKNFSSEDMASQIEKIGLNGDSTINFIIGGSYGVSEDIRKSADLRLSFSKMTFPHQLMRLILIEQIYRWFSIIKNTKYHK